MKYVGVDLDKSQYSVCWKLEDEGTEFERHTMTQECIGRFKKKLDKHTEVVMEAIGNSKYSYDSITDVVRKVRVINPLQFKVISESVRRQIKKLRG